MKYLKSSSLFAAILFLSFNTVAFANFSDVDANTNYHESIEWMADNGVINGYGDGTFGPDNCVNRAEILKMVFEVLELNPFEYEAELFLDTPADAWYSPYVKTARNKGTIEGFSDGTFRPDQCVTRAEAVKIAVYEFNNGEIPGYRSSYGIIHDLNHNDWFYELIDYAFSANAVGTLHGAIGHGSYNYYSNQSMTRKEVAHMLYSLKSIRDNDLDFYNGAEPDLILPPAELAGDLIEVVNPNFTMPLDVHENQLNKFFKLGDLYFALAMRNSMNVLLDLPVDYEVSFVGVLMANEDTNEWEKLIQIEDAVESDKNNPYYMWGANDELFLTVVDQNGAGSGEGLMKLYRSESGFEWELEGCYYFVPNYSDAGEDVDYYELSMNVSDQEEQAIENCENISVFSLKTNQ